MSVYKAPSMKTLQVLHWLDDNQRKQVRDLIHGRINPLKYTSVSQWNKQCFHPITWHDATMKALDEVLETFGVETIWHKGKVKAEYCNTGEAYTPTIVYRHDIDAFQLTSWGDLVERYNWDGNQY